MLSTEQSALLLRYYQTVELTAEQKDRLIATYWAANEAERRDIARVYAKTFAEDGAFVQRLVAYFDLRRSGGAPPVTGSTADAAKLSDSGGAATHQVNSPLSAPPDAMNSGSVSCPASPSSPSSFCSPVGSPVSGSGGCGYVSARLTHSQRLLRTALQDKFPKLIGGGPFALSFDLVRTESERKEMIDLYASQFTAPDPPELHRLVTLPQSHSTRTRRRISGNYSWYIRCLSTQEMVCAVTVTAHTHQTHRFVEMPLFATAGGYKRNGFGRLLNAALAAWCVGAHFEFIMISADLNAIPFWRHMGYSLMSASEKKKIEFFYEHECCKFTGAEPMVGYCLPSPRFRGGSAASQLPHALSAARDTATAAITPVSELRVEDVLRKMPKFTVVGPIELKDSD